MYSSQINPTDGQTTREPSSSIHAMGGGIQTALILIEVRPTAFPLHVRWTQPLPLAYAMPHTSPH